MSIKIVISSIALAFICDVLTVTGRQVNSTDSITIYPAEYTRALKNPLMGFREWNISTLNEWATVGKYYVGWNELENKAADGVNKIIDWTNEHFTGIADKNFKVVPRVWLDYPGRDPAWPADMTEGDYTSDQFKKRVKAFVRKLGMAWDNDPRIAYIEMGIIGKWGEQHSPEPSIEMQNILAKAFMDAFKNKKVVRRHPWDFTDYNFGIYWDSFSHANEVVTHEAAMLAMGDYWKTAIIEGETAYDWGDYKIQPGDDPDDTVTDTIHRHFLENLIYELHCSGLGWVTHYDASNPAAKAGGEEVQKTFGYRFVIEDFTYPEKIEAGTPFNVSFSVVNKGAAPFYYDWPVELSLLDTNKNVVWKQNFSNVDIRTWYPGEDYDKAKREYNIAPEKYLINSSFVLNAPISAGTYIIAVSILDPAGNLPSLRFAVNNYFTGGRHPIGYVGFGSTPSDFKIDPGLFDDLYEDNSLHYDPGFEPETPVKIILDCDFGDDADDLAALLMLHHMQDNAECEVLAIGQCNSTPKALRAIDIINTYYGRPDIPLGQQQSDTHIGDQYITFLIDNYPELSDLDYNYNPDVIDLYRKTLAAAPDHSIKFIVVGLKKDMADLIKSGPDEFSPLTGSELVAQKVTGVYDMGGIFPSGKEFNYELEPASTKYYMENWPTPMWLAGSCVGGIHIGEDLRLMNTPPGKAMDHKLAGNGGIYWDGKPVEDYQHAFDCAPTIAAVRGDDTYFNLVSGCNKVNNDGSNYFVQGDTCNHTYVDCGNQKVSFESIGDEIEDMITAAPLLGNDDKYQLSVNIVGSGSVVPSSGRFKKDSTISLVATPDAGYIFTGWSSDASGTDTVLNITMQSDLFITATFVSITSVFDQRENKFNYQIYPNPFKDFTLIEYTITNPVFVNLSIYNLLGDKVITFVRQKQKVGEYQFIWKGRDVFNSRIKNGTYIINLQIGDVVFKEKIILNN